MNRNGNRVCIAHAGAGEDVEGVLLRLNAQSAENALLRERQAKANSDMQVGLRFLLLPLALFVITPHMLLLLTHCDNCVWLSDNGVAALQSF